MLLPPEMTESCRWRPPESVSSVLLHGEINIGISILIEEIKLILIKEINIIQWWKADGNLFYYSQAEGGGKVGGGEEEEEE